MGKVVYGTSDARPNCAEVLLTCLAGEELGTFGVGFFVYPKGSEWISWEGGIYAPHEPPPLAPAEALAEAGLPQVEIFPLHQMVEGEVGVLELGEIAQLIRAERKIKAFRAVNFPPGSGGPRPVYVSSKDRAWKFEWAQRPLGEVVSSPSIKLGGAFIYFLYGAWLARHREEVIGLLPGKQKPDVLGAFAAGSDWAGGSPVVYRTGEIDVLTAEQFQLFRQDKKWRVAPPWVIRRLIEKVSVLEEVRRRLLEEKIYTLLVYDEEGDKFLMEGIPCPP